MGAEVCAGPHAARRTARAAMGDEPTIRIAQSCAAEPRVAVRELHAGLAQPEHVAGAVLLLQRLRPRGAGGGDCAHVSAGVPVVGCTTAGEIGPLGCRDHSLDRRELRRRSVCTAVIGHLDDLGGFSIPDGVAFARDLRRRLEDEAQQADAHEHLRLPARRRPLRARGAAGPRPAAGPGRDPAGRRFGRRQLSFESTYIYWDGDFVSGSAVLVLDHHAASVHRVQDAALRAHRRAARGDRGGPRPTRGQRDQRPAGG